MSEAENNPGRRSELEQRQEEAHQVIKVSTARVMSGSVNNEAVQPQAALRAMGANSCLQVQGRLMTYWTHRLVFSPGPLEVDAAVKPFLEHQPAPSAGLHVTVHLRDNTVTGNSPCDLIK